MNRKQHWENVYATKAANEVSWYREHLENSLKMIAETKVEQAATIIDVGGGASTLIDDLLKERFGDVAVLDISGKAIDESKKRLGRAAEKVSWIVADITKAVLPENHYDVWHDRAVFHFLTDAEDRRKYIELVNHSVKIGGHIIVASFGENGPPKCSGLDVVRYNPDSMHSAFGDDFRLVNSLTETHRTPFDTTQEFVYCYCRKSK